ncbi:MAG: helix-turn-helix transcriptional regulator [Planctomycetota bacterium]|jgi:excisionase family DNA binding protein
MNATSTTDRLLTAQMLAERLSLSKRQVHRLNSAGRIPAPIRIGGSVRWSERTVNRWIEAGAPDRRTFEAMQQARGE